MGGVELSRPLSHSLTLASDIDVPAPPRTRLQLPHRPGPWFGFRTPSTPRRPAREPPRSRRAGEREGEGGGPRAHRARLSLPAAVRAVLFPLLLARVQRESARPAPRRGGETEGSSARWRDRARNRTPIRFPARGPCAPPHAPTPRAHALASPCRPHTARRRLTAGSAAPPRLRTRGPRAAATRVCPGVGFARGRTAGPPASDRLARSRPAHGVAGIQPRSTGSAGGQEVAPAARGGSAKSTALADRTARATLPTHTHAHPSHPRFPPLTRPSTAG